LSKTPESPEKNFVICYSGKVLTSMKDDGPSVVLRRDKGESIAECGLRIVGWGKKIKKEESGRRKSGERKEEV
jgi:hypothetical protein